jgi:hypothetical protein
MHDDVCIGLITRDESAARGHTMAASNNGQIVSSSRAVSLDDFTISHVVSRRSRITRVPKGTELFYKSEIVGSEHFQIMGLASSPDTLPRGALVISRPAARALLPVVGKQMRKCSKCKHLFSVEGSGRDQRYRVVFDDEETQYYDAIRQLNKAATGRVCTDCHRTGVHGLLFCESDCNTSECLGTDQQCGCTEGALSCAICRGEFHCGCDQFVGDKRHKYHETRDRKQGDDRNAKVTFYGRVVSVKLYHTEGDRFFTRDEPIEGRYIDCHLVGLVSNGNAIPSGCTETTMHEAYKIIAAQRPAISQCNKCGVLCAGPYEEYGGSVRLSDEQATWYKNAVRAVLFDPDNPMCTQCHFINIHGRVDCKYGCQLLKCLDAGGDCRCAADTAREDRCSCHLVFDRTCYPELVYHDADVDAERLLPRASGSTPSPAKTVYSSSSMQSSPYAASSGAASVFQSPVAYRSPLSISSVASSAGVSPLRVTQTSDRQDFKRMQVDSPVVISSDAESVNGDSDPVVGSEKPVCEIGESFESFWNRMKEWHDKNAPG